MTTEQRQIGLRERYMSEANGAQRIEGKIARGEWLEGREYHRRDGRIFVDLREYERWVVKG